MINEVHDAIRPFEIFAENTFISVNKGINYSCNRRVYLRSPSCIHEIESS